jgi:methyl-accepting chemotaxis protein
MVTMFNFTRRNYFIDKKLQTKYILLAMAVLVVHTIVVLAAVFSPYIMMLSLDFPIAERTEAAKAFLLLHANAWPAIGGIILLFGVLTLFETHRIAGPIFRIKRGIRDIADGKLNMTIHLRRNDEFHDVAEELNSLSARFRQTVLMLQDNSSQLEAHIAEIETEIREKRLEETTGRRIVQKLQGSKETIQDILDRFHL